MTLGPLANPTLPRQVYKRWANGEDVSRQRHLVDSELRNMRKRRQHARRVLHAALTRGIA